MVKTGQLTSSVRATGS